MGICTTEHSSIEAAKSLTYPQLSLTRFPPHAADRGVSGRRSGQMWTAYKSTCIGGAIASQSRQGRQIRGEGSPVPHPRCTPACYRSMPPMQRYLTSRNSSMPYFEPSRPMPLSFMPPKGAISVEMMPSLMPTMPYSRASATRQIAANVAAVEIGGETELGVVGHLDRLGVCLEAVERGDRAEGFFPGDDHVGCHIGQYRRLKEAAALCCALAAGDHPGRPS